MKEPIRKIRVFSDRLKVGLQDRLSDEQLRFFQRIELAGTRMSLLIDDLLEYSYVSKGSMANDLVDLNEV